MKKSFFRIIVVVFLVCALLVSWSPIRAKAVGTEQYVAVVIDKVGFYAQAGAVSTGAAVFGYVLAGIGLVVSTAQAIDLMNDYMEWSGELDTAIYYYPDGSWSYGVDVGFVDRVRAFLFDSGYIINNASFEFTTTQTCNLTGKEYVLSADSPFAVVGLWYNPGGRANETEFYVFGSSLDGFTFNGTGKRAADYGYYSAALILSNGADADPRLNSDCPIVEVPDLTDATIADFFGREIPADLVTTIDGAELATVAPPEFDISVGYPEWHINARPTINPDTDEEITVLPIPLNPSVSPETQIGTLTQPDIWQGSIADPMPGTGTVPDGSIAETPWDAVKKWVSDFFIPSGDITMYSLDLTELFPFCIPFDLFDLLSALRADPVAPVFELELDFGITKAPIVVDLSGWSDLASIVRILEVGLFCIGLALGTKELIGS